MEFTQFYSARDAEDVNALIAHVGQNIEWKLTVNGERTMDGQAVLLGVDPYQGHPLDVDLRFDIADPHGETLLSAIDDAQDDGILWVKTPTDPNPDFELRPPDPT